MASTAAPPRSRPRAVRAIDRAFLPAALEIVETPASPTLRLTALAICAVFAAGLLWAWFGRVDVVAVASGKIIASSRTKVLQPTEIGTIQAIAVVEGQHVKAGDVLIQMDHTTSGAERDRAAADLARASLDVARLRSLLEPGSDDPFSGIAADPIDIAAARRQAAAQRALQQAKLDEQTKLASAKQAEVAASRASIAKLTDELPLAEERARIRADGVKSGFGSELSYVEAETAEKDLETSLPLERHKLEAAEAELAGTASARAEIAAEFTRGAAADLGRAEEQANAAKEALAKASERNRRELIAAPVDGIVEGLTVHTLGGVVTPAQQLVTIVPSEGGLEVEAVVDNRDIGFVTSGQTAEVKIETFPFTRYGLIRGTVEQVSMDAIAGDGRDERPAEGSRRAADEPAAEQRAQRLVYTAHVALDRSRMSIDDRMVDLIPGMAVTAEIKTGRRRVLDYLLSPLGDYLHDALRER